MASRPKKISVSVTPGQNTPVNHVIRFEDLLQQVQQAAPKAAARRGAAARALAPIQQLAADLEARMRELRGGDAPPSPASPARAARGRKKA